MPTPPADDSPDSSCTTAESPVLLPYLAAATFRPDPALLAAFGLWPDQFAGETIVDFGGDGDLPGRYFSDSRVAAIDAADRTAVAEFAGRASCVVSINAQGLIDNPARGILGMQQCLKPYGVAVASVDLPAADGSASSTLTPESLIDDAIAAGLRIERGYLYTPQRRNYRSGYACTIVARIRQTGQDDGRHAPLLPLRNGVQLLWDDASRHTGSLARRARRVVRGESRTVQRWLGKAA